MKILILSQYFWPENFRINDLALDLQANNVDVTVLTGSPNYPDGIVFKDFKKNKNNFNNLKKISIIRVPIIPRGKSKVQLALNYLTFIISASTIGIWKLRKHNFDYVIFFGTSPTTSGIPAVLISKIFNAPLITWILDIWPDTLLALGTIKSKLILNAISYLVSIIYKNSDYILGQSEIYLSKINEIANDQGKLIYFPNWIETDLEKTKANKLDNYDKSSNFELLFAGNFGEAQDFPSLLKTIKILKDENIYWNFLGSGRVLEDFKKNLRISGLQEKVNFYEPVPLKEVKNYFDKADALILSLQKKPIFEITVPGKLQSYMVASKPILAMLDGEANRIITEANCGLASDAEDSKMFSENILKMAKLTERERETLGKNGRDYAINNFSKKKILNALYKILQTKCS